MKIDLVGLLLCNHQPLTGQEESPQVALDVQDFVDLAIPGLAMCRPFFLSPRQPGRGSNCSYRREGNSEKLPLSLLASTHGAIQELEIFIAQLVPESLKPAPENLWSYWLGPLGQRARQNLPTIFLRCRWLVLAAQHLTRQQMRCQSGSRQRLQAEPAVLRIKRLGPLCVGFQWRGLSRQQQKLQRRLIAIPLLLDRNAIHVAPTL